MPTFEDPKRRRRRTRPGRSRSRLRDPAHRDPGRHVRGAWFFASGVVGVEQSLRQLAVLAQSTRPIRCHGRRGPYGRAGTCSESVSLLTVAAASTGAGDQLVMKARPRTGTSRGNPTATLLPLQTTSPPSLEALTNARQPSPQTLPTSSTCAPGRGDLSGEAVSGWSAHLPGDPISPAGRPALMSSSTLRSHSQEAADHHPRRYRTYHH